MDHGMGNGQAIASVHETSVSSAAAQAKATVEARYIVAIQRPRDWDMVRQRVLKACKRRRFAESAIYKKPVGGGSVEGPSVRFAEEAVRSMGNVDVQTPTLFEDDHKRIVRVSVTDLESNTTYSVDVSIAKTVERKSLKSGQQALSQRTNSYGKTVYLVPATDDELANKTNALISKALRNSALRILPSDILEEALELVRETTRKADSQDPDAARKRLLDAFADLGVRAESIKEFVGLDDLQSVSPRDIAELRQIFQAIRDGETSWRDVMESRRAARGDDKPAEKAPAEKGAEGVRAKLNQRKKAQGTADEHAVPDGAQSWISDLNSAPHADEIEAIARDLAEASGDLSDEANEAIESAMAAARERVGAK